MVSLVFSRAMLLASLALMTVLVPKVSQAADRYCANRYMPLSQETACFKTKVEALQYIRTEPATPSGNSMLELKVATGANGNFSETYYVKPVAPTFYGDYYVADDQWGKGRACSSGGVAQPNGQIACDDEDKLSADINASYTVPVLDHYYTGAYNLENGPGWGNSGQYVYLRRDYPSNNPNARKYMAALSATTIRSWTVRRTDWFKCPALFLGTWANPNVDKWPEACANTSRGEIYWKSAQHNSCCKDGNPTVAATGNKEYRETDFDWEGEAFSRAYNSIDDLVLKSDLTDSWAHSFSTRLMMSAGAPQVWITSDGYLEALKLNSTTASYASVNRPGVVLIKEPDEIAAQRGRWRLSDASDLRWFDETGRLASFNRAGRAFYLDYCSDADVQSGACLAAGNLLRVRSPSGRVLSFVYVAAIAPQLDDNGVRLLRVTADGAVLAEYAYDGLGRLTHASKAGAGEGTEYVYAEAAHLCRTAAGGSVPGCNAGYFSHHLTGVIDESGQRYATYDYDESGRVVASEHAGGAGKVTLTYTASGGTTVTLPTGSTKAYTFSTEIFRQPTKVAMSVTDGSLAGTDTAFYSGNRRQWSENARGMRTQYTYDHFYELTRKTGLASGNGNVTALTRTTQTDWLPSYSLPSERRILDNANALVAKSKWTYNDRGQALTSTQIDPATGVERTATSTYCDSADVTAGLCPVLGSIRSVDGPRSDVNDVVTFTYYAGDDPACAAAPAACAYRKGDSWKTTNALGQVSENLRYDHAGRVLSNRDANGVVTDLEYTPRGWLAASKVRGPNAGSEADDVITRYEYDLIGQVTKVIQPDGAFVRYEYDAAHRLTDIYDNAGNRIHYTLDAAGARTKEETKDNGGALKRSLSRIYNQLGQLKTAKTAYDQPTGFTYDATGNGDLTTDALGRKSDNDYDPLNRLAKSLQDVGGINAKTEFKYDALDRLTQVTDPKNLNTTYGYNGFGDQVQLTSPDTGVSSFTYDSAGNRKTETDARNVTRNYSYDALNRVTAVTYPTASLNVGYAYDAVPTVCAADENFAKGRLSLITDASGSTQYCYDRFGRTVRKVQTTNGKVFTLRYAYTLAGQLSSLTYPDGGVVSYQRDAQGRISQIDSKRAAPGAITEVLLSQVAYHPFGPTAGWTYGNGRTFARPVDLDYRTIAVSDPSPGGLSFGFGFDAVGNIDKLTPAGATNALIGFSYDALNRLTHLRDGPTNTPIEAYSYDATGNRQSVTNASGSQSYTYPTDSHRLTQAGPSSPRSYDASGNSIQIGGNSFVYNDAGRSSELKQGATLVQTYLYNGKGEQVRKYTASIDRYMVYSESGQWLGEYDGSGNVIQQAIWMDDLPVGLWAGNGGQQALHYIEPDHLGTPRVVIDPVRNVAVWNWDLKGEAFGNSAPNQDPDMDGAGLVFDMRFPGQRSDSQSGLSYNYFRDYEAAAGRYVQSDPVGLRGGVSTYGYALENPLTIIDPLGLAPSPACVAAWVGSCSVIGGGIGYWGGGALGGAAGTPVPVAGNAAGFVAGSTLGGLGGASAGGLLGGVIAGAVCPSDKKCPPCKLLDGTEIAPGTIGYRHDKVPPSAPHHPFLGDHYNLYKANQNPNNCKCFWQSYGAADAVGGLPPPAGSVPIQPFL